MSLTDSTLIERIRELRAKTGLSAMDAYRYLRASPPQKPKPRLTVIIGGRAQA